MVPRGCFLEIHETVFVVAWVCGVCGAVSEGRKATTLFLFSKHDLVTLPEIGQRGEAQIAPRKIGRAERPPLERARPPCDLPHDLVALLDGDDSLLHRPSDRLQRDTVRAHIRAGEHDRLVVVVDRDRHGLARCEDRLELEWLAVDLQGQPRVARGGDSDR